MMMMMMMMMMIVSFCVGWGTALKLDVNPLRVMLWYLRAHGYIKKKPNGHFQDSSEFPFGISRLTKTHWSYKIIGGYRWLMPIK